MCAEYCNTGNPGTPGTTLTKMKKFVTTRTTTTVATLLTASPPSSACNASGLLRSATCDEQNAIKDNRGLMKTFDSGTSVEEKHAKETSSLTEEEEEVSRKLYDPDPATSAKGDKMGPMLEPVPSPPVSTGVVKMCGYLKKKRNKMGGWRKLFFVLQNQLLLSYSSRDEYEKKLGPFKDIINLLPGTIIIPTTGPRFTIETNSKVLYTFRCDEHRNCSEWIMALLDSLNAINGTSGTERSLSLHNSVQRSTILSASASLRSRNVPFDSAISRLSIVEEIKQADRSVKRSEPHPATRCAITSHFERRQQQLAARETHIEHDPNNNKMSQAFGRRTPGNCAKRCTDAEPRNTQDNGSICGAELNVEHDPADSDFEKKVAAADADIHAEEVQDIKEHKDRPPSNVVPRAHPKMQIFRLHENMWNNTQQSLDVCRINRMFNGPSPTLQEMASDPGVRAESKQRELSLRNEPVASTVQPALCMSTTVPCDDCLSSNRSGDENVYETIGLPETADVPQHNSEPIYAVVDFEAKRSNRCARQVDDIADNDDSFRRTSTSLPQIPTTRTERVDEAAANACSNDYNDMNHKRMLNPVDASNDDTMEPLTVRQNVPGDDPIYEPISLENRSPFTAQIGSSSSLPCTSEHQSTGRGLWLQLKRLHLQDFARGRFMARKPMAENETPRRSEQRPGGALALKGFGRRLDCHRRSISKRIKHFCDRFDPGPPSTDTTAHRNRADLRRHKPSGPEDFVCVQRARKSISLDSFLMAKRQSSSRGAEDLH